MLRAVSRFAAKKDIRYYLNGVLIEVYANVAYIVATNGHALAVGRIARDDHALMEGQGAAIIPAEFLAKIKTGRVLELILTVSDAEDGVSDFTLDDVSEGTKTSGKTIDGKFPDWRRVVPSKVSGIPSQFNPEYLSVCMKASQDMGSRLGNIAIGYNGAENQADKPTGRTYDGAALVDVGDENLTVVLMPWTQTAPTVSPEWVREDSAGAGRLDVDAALEAVAEIAALEAKLAAPVAMCSPDIAAAFDPDGTLQAAGLMAIAA